MMLSIIHRHHTRQSGGGDKTDAHTQLPQLRDVSPHVLERYFTKLFRIGDRNGDGFLDPQELALLLVRSGFDFSWQLIRSIVAAADTNHDGLIDADEFVPLMLQLIWHYEGFTNPRTMRSAPPAWTGIDEMLSTLDTMISGPANSHLESMIAEKEEDILRSFLRCDIWLDNALPRGVHLFNHTADDPSDISQSGDLPDLESELRAIQLHRLTRDRVHDIFDMLDTNQNFRLSREQCTAVLGTQLTERFMDKMDSDKDGEISLTEWMGFFEQMAEKAKAQDVSADVYFEQVGIFLDVMMQRCHRRLGDLQVVGTQMAIN